MERWKDIKGYEGQYQVSDLGRIRSLDRLVNVGQSNTKRRIRGCILNPGHSSHGHQHVTLCDGSGSRKTALVHQKVIEAFVGPRPKGQEVCHNNGNAKDNRLSNLRYDTHKNNQAQRKEHGTHLPGEENPWSKLTNDQVLEIVKLYNQGNSSKDIGNLFGIDRHHVLVIIRGEAWSHITGIKTPPLNLKSTAQSKLTEAQANEIIKRVKQGEMQKDLAVEFCISRPSVCSLVKGDTWKHLKR